MKNVHYGPYLIGLCIACANCAAAQAPVIMPAIPGNFTLIYDIDYSDITTPQWRSHALEVNHQQLADMVKDGTITQATADYNIKLGENREYASHRKGQLVVSVSGGKVLCSLRGNNVYPMPGIVVYDGIRTESIDGPANGHDTFYLKPGFVSQDMMNLPFPAANFANMPVLDSVRIPESLPLGDGVREVDADVSQGPSTGGIQLIPGKITYSIVQDRPQLISVQSDWQGHSVATWNFSGYKLFKGVWIGTKFSFIRNEQNDGSPLFKTDYNLVSASNNPLPAADFDLENMLGEGDTAQSGDMAFNYDPKGGPLAQQIAQAGQRKQLAEQLANKGTVSTHARSGIFVLLAICAGATAFFFARRVRGARP